jgi:hypothetical protein
MFFPEPEPEVDPIAIQSAEDWGYVAFFRGISLCKIEDTEARAGWLDAQGACAYLFCILEARRNGEDVSWDDVPF